MGGLDHCAVIALECLHSHPHPSAPSPQGLRGEASSELEHRAQNLKQILAARMLYFKVLDRPDVLHK
jgi:hypothetical protein